MDSDKDQKAGNLVTDMLSAGVVKPSEKLKASMAKKAGQVTESDRHRIEEMLKGLDKYKNLEDSESRMDKHPQMSGPEKPVKLALRQEKSPKPEHGGLLDFIDAEMTDQSINAMISAGTSHKSGKEIVIKPAATLNNKTNLAALSTAFQNLTINSTGASSKEVKNQETLDDSENESKENDGKTKRQRRRKNKGKQQDNLGEGVLTVKVDDEDLKPILVYGMLFILCPITNNLYVLPW